MLKDEIVLGLDDLKPLGFEKSVECAILGFCSEAYMRDQSLIAELLYLFEHPTGLENHLYLVI